MSPDSQESFLRFFLKVFACPLDSDLIQSLCVPGYSVSGVGAEAGLLTYRVELRKQRAKRKGICAAVLFQKTLRLLSSECQQMSPDPEPVLGG